MEVKRIHGLTLILILALLYLQYSLWFDKGGLHEMIRLKKQLSIELAQNKQLKQRNQELVMQIKRLQKSDEAIEAKARQELGMIKKGETFYQLVE